MLIPAVAIPHVIVAQFAVGGGFLLADLVRRAYGTGNEALLACLRRLARFFVLLTLVFGAVTGVGIWWTIGLTSPETTSALIHTFVFGWASEWVAFLVELAAAFAFYALWDRLPPRQHVAVGWVYAIAAWVSLVLITGITAFMLTSGSWTPQRGFFTAFFNPSFVPQVLLRSGGSLALAALGIGLFVSLQALATAHKDLLIGWISRWALLGMGLLLAGGVWYLLVMPEHATLNLLRAPMLLIMLLLNLAVTLAVIVALAVGHAAGSAWLTPPSAFFLVLAGIVAITTGEFIREGARKPYRIENYILAPGVRVAEVPQFHEQGFIARTPWLRAYLQARLPGFDPARLAALPAPQQETVGEGIFRYHCASCHALWGYNGMVPLVLPWTPELVAHATQHLHLTNPAMPPWLGNEAERQALTAYLVQLGRRGR